ncbi:MAG: phosphatase PAP2 family protein [Alistipes sp.]|nr:phosphatase PAP2 family protein [Alistipes sp.]
MYTFDHDLFLWLNFDGGAVLDAIMLTLSKPIFWTWLYLIMLYIVWRKEGWRTVLLFVVALALSVVAADMIAGIFKHTGLLGGLWESFPARLRPMYTPELEGEVHFVKLGGKFGTVSAHAGTMAAVAVVAIGAIRRRWFSWLMVSAVVLVCYSRIYLGYHFPVDIVLGLLTGVMSGAVMLAAYRYIRRHYIIQRPKE